MPYIVPALCMDKRPLRTCATACVFDDMSKAGNVMRNEFEFVDSIIAIFTAVLYAKASALFALDVDVVAKCRSWHSCECSIRHSAQVHAYHKQSTLE